MQKTRYLHVFKTSLLLILTTAGAIACSKNDLSADSSMSKEMAQGKVLYNQHCAGCHGVNLEGQPNWKERNEQGRLPAPPHDETGHTWHHADQLLFELTKFGMVPPNVPGNYESDMPAFKDILTDDQIWAVLNYIKNRWPEETQKIQQEMTAGDSSFKKP